ncbi:MAG TPA: hypothetical protein VMU83_07865 [Hanamia sp.]|nr:hypothetical protein [Hanamia sp.]
MKGKTNNPSGRPKGVPNKTTTDLRQWINNFIDDNREQIKKDWNSLEPKDRIFLFEKLLKYSLPTLTSTTLNAVVDVEKKQVMIINGKEIEF